MSFPRYPKYKDSGVEWLGDVPEHWEVRRLKFLCNIQTGDKDTENAVEDGEYPFFVRSQTVERINSHTFDCEAILTAGDGVGVGKVFHYYKGKFDFHQRVYMMNEFRDASGKFLFHFLRENFYKVALEGGAKSTVDSLRRPLFTNFPVVLPTEAEQESISQFVETEASKIDSLVAEQRRLIELLKEKRQAVISHAVTKGLNPHAPMKPSGIEWLGDVPEHWSVAAVRFRYTVQLGKMLDTEKITGKHLKPYLRVFDVQWGTINIDDLPQMDFDPSIQNRFRLTPGDLLINEGGSYPGRSAIWNGDLEECYFQKALHRLRPCDPTMDTARFFFYIMAWATTHGVFTAGGNESTIEHLPAERFRKYRFGFPPMSEQLAIAEFLDSELGGLDALTAEAERAIELLQERRTALISATVTGRIDVRGLA